MIVLTVPRNVAAKVPAWAWTWAQIVPGRGWGLEAPPYARYEERAKAEETLLRLLEEFAPPRTREAVKRRLGWR